MKLSSAICVCFGRHTFIGLSFLKFTSGVRFLHFNSIQLTILQTKQTRLSRTLQPPTTTTPTGFKFEINLLCRRFVSLRTLEFRAHDLLPIFPSEIIAAAAAIGNPDGGERPGEELKLDTKILELQVLMLLFEIFCPFLCLQSPCNFFQHHEFT
jgi:hypothetical protein